MSTDISVNAYKYTIDAASLNDNIRLVLNNASYKNEKKENTVFEQNKSTNSALLFEYNQNIAKSNIAQQLVLDNNLKETLKFLNSEAAKKISKSNRKKTSDIIDEILFENDVPDYNSDEPSDKNEDADNLELFDIKIDDDAVNIFAA